MNSISFISRFILELSLVTVRQCVTSPTSRALVWPTCWTQQRSMWWSTLQSMQTMVFSILAFMLTIFLIAISQGLRINFAILVSIYKWCLLRYFRRSTDFIHSAVSGGGLVVVNCYMGLSRSASCVLAYLIAKQDMSLNKVGIRISYIIHFLWCFQALDYIKRSRAVRPNEGFLKQLKVFERQPRY